MADNDDTAPPATPPPAPAAPAAPPPASDRSEWLARAMRQHAGVLELRERCRPLLGAPRAPAVSGIAAGIEGAGAASFGRDHRRAARTEAPDALPPAAVMELVLHYLHESGLTETRDALLREAETLMPELCDALRGGLGSDPVDYTQHTGDPSLRHSLAPLLRLGCKDATSLFGPLPAPSEGDPEVEAPEVYSFLDALDEDASESSAPTTEFDASSDDSDDDDASLDTNVAKVQAERENVPLWEEEATEGENCLFRGAGIHREIVAGTLNQLVRWLAGGVGGRSGDASFQSAFFLAYPAFATPERLLSKLAQLHAEPANAGAGRGPALRALTAWVQKEPLDFCSESLHDQIVRFARAAEDAEASHALPQAGAAQGGGATQAREALRELSAALAKLDEAKARMLRDMATADDELPSWAPRAPRGVEPNPPRVPFTIFSPRLTIDDVDEGEIANQLCLRDMRAFYRIRERELLACAWRRNGAQDAAAPNVCAMMRRFNELSRWAVHSLLEGRFVEGAPVDRRRVFKRLSTIADHLVRLRNYHSSLALYSALSCGAVVRALLACGVQPEVFGIVPADPAHGRPRRGTLDMSQCSSLQTLGMLFSPEGNYAEYRRHLREANRSSERVAALHIHLRDFAVLHDTIPDTLNGMINWHKYACWARAMNEFLRPAQLVFYNLQVVEQIQALLRDFPNLPDEGALMDRALAIQRGEAK
eukprot:m51a1_g3427 hypothetical protein (709) ;mRNA; r:610009-612429